MAGFISDGDAVGFMSDARFELFKRNMHAFAAALRAGGSASLDAPAAGPAMSKLFDDFFGGAASPGYFARSSPPCQNDPPFQSLLPLSHLPRSGLDHFQLAISGMSCR